MDASTEKDRKHLTNLAIELIHRTAAHIATNLEGCEVTKELEKLQKVVSSHCKADLDFDSEKKVLQDLQQHISELEDIEEVNFDQVHANIQKQNASNKNIEKHLWYKEFKKKMVEVQNRVCTDTEMEVDEDEDVAATQVTKTYIDHFTKQIMQQPMKNKQCGHSYDRVAVISMLKKTSKLRCPYPFCTSYIVEKHLVEDVELLAEIRTVTESD